MQELVGRLTALDAEATETLKVIAYFDALVNGHATIEVLLRGAAVLSGCAAGVSADGIRLRVDAAGARVLSPPGEWPSREFGHDGIAWIERTGSLHANDEMILERLAIALGIAVDRTSPPASSRRALHTLVDAQSTADARAEAARRLHLAPHAQHRVVVIPADEPAAPSTPSIVMKTPVGSVRVSIYDVQEPPARRAGIGLSHSTDDLSQSYASALTALRLTSLREPMLRADDLGAALLLAEVAPSQPVPDVTALSELVREHPGADGLLDAIANTESLRAAGVAVGLHHSTVQARAAHYCEALGFDFRSPQGRVRLALAIALYRLATTRFD